MFKLFSPARKETLKDKCLSQSEISRFRLMKKHMQEHNCKPHHDFLSQVRDSKNSDHAHFVEHEAAAFWNYYYGEERPLSLLRDESMLLHEYGTNEDRQSIEEHMLAPEQAICVIPTDGISKPASSEGITTQKRWIDHLHIAEAAVRSKTCKCKGDADNKCKETCQSP